MGDVSENFKQKVKQITKTVIKKGGKKLILALVPILLIVALLAGAVYFITIDDGTYKDDDWGNTNYGASQYINSVSVNSDGTISNSTTAEELWDKMLKNGCRVDKYLSSPKELARIMRAEIVTQYPDTRKNPDEDFDWKDIIDDPDNMQGIIKFKRADNKNNKTTMTYVDPETFQSYIDEYNKTGSETAKNNALTHFTLKKTAASTATGNGGAVAAGEGVMTDVSQKIIDAINKTNWPGASLCAKWVDDVYQNAGLTPNRKASAYMSYLANGISTDKTAIPIGAAVYGTGSGLAGGPYGHVGIYIGDGKVVDSVTTGKKTSTLEEWIGWQERQAVNANNQLADLNGNIQHGWLGWGWADGNKTRGTTEDTSVTPIKSKTESKKDSNKKEETSNNQTAVETEESGDGYDKTYTSSAGIKYKLYKQSEKSCSQNSYAGNHYWEGTVATDGCGPSSIAILASGVLNSEMNPGDVAAQMSKTSYETLQAEMNSLGMNAEVIQSPSAETIQDNLRNGKVMLVSVNSSTQFTGNSHIMTLIDINEQGQVYIGNPGSREKNGWYDISEIMKGCQYIVTTDAGAAGVANSTNTSNYVAVVATWSEHQVLMKTNDPNVQGKYGIGGEEKTVEHTYTMTTSTVNFQEMVEPYTVPFDLLWAFMVVGEDKKFVFDFADLIYNSDIQITVYDNKTTNTDIDDWNYTQRTKADVDVEITAQYTDSVSGKTFSEVKNNQHVDDPYSETTYNTRKTVITTTNTINTVLTRANVWTVDYKNEYTYSEPNETGGDPNTISHDDQQYADKPDTTKTGNVDFNCEHIESAEQEVINNVINKYMDDDSAGPIVIPSENPSENHSSSTSTKPVPSASSVNVKRFFNYVKMYTKYVNISDTVTNKVETQKYIQGVPEVKEKTDKDADEPNFVTIFLKKKNRKNKKNVLSVPKWLFEIIEENDSTSDMLDLIKYLLYKATGKSYGIKEFDFNSYFSPKTLITVGSGDYIVNIDMSDPNLVITDLNTLKQAFSWYSNDRVLQQYASYFLECQEKYRVNAIFAAAVSITESSAGTNVQIGGNNMFSISNGGQGNWNQYGSMNSSIDAFFSLISKEYFTNSQYSVDSISRGNPVGSHCYCVPPDDWIKNTCTYMTGMFNAAGITTTTSSGETTEKGEKIVAAAKEKLGCPYVYGAAGPSTFDCSGLTMWCYKKIGIDLPHNDLAQKNAATKVVSVSEARVGDILWRSGHVAIYIGNGQCIEAPHTGDVVKINNVGSRFTSALQFY